MKIIIVGAGLSGISAAICFSKHGHNVEVLERGSELLSRGGGINIRPAASRVMHQWGLKEDLKAISLQTPSVKLRDLKTGDMVLREVPVNMANQTDWGTTRQAAMKMFYKKAVDLGAAFTFNATVTAVADDETQAYVTLQDGKRIYGDIIIASDGVKSRIRQMVLADYKTEQSFEPVVDNTTFYGFTIPSDQLSSDPNSMRLLDNVSINTWIGAGGFVVTRNMPQINEVGLLFGIYAETDQKSLWDENGDIEHVRKFFAGSCDELVKALSMADKCDRWRLVEMPNLPRWCSRAGRIFLLGDSAHAMHPNAAQGFSSTVEDIGVLDFLLSQAATRPDFSISKVASDWEAIRKPRVERIKAYARWNTELFLGIGNSRESSSRAADKQRTKDLEKVVPNKDAEFHSSAFLKWTLDFDAIGDVS